MKKVNYKTVESIIRRDGEWVGLVVPSKFNPYSHWVRSYVQTLTRDSLDENHTLSGFISTYKNYNCNSELGLHVTFYQRDGAED